MLKIEDDICLSDVLAAIEPEASDLHWSVLYLHELVAGGDSVYDNEFVAQSIKKSPSGWQLKFPNLQRFAEQAIQVNDGLFAATRDPENLPLKTDSDEQMLASAEILVADVDTSFFLVSAPEVVLARIESAFEDVTEADDDEDLSSWPRD
jgi:hypothetical protein